MEITKELKDWWFNIFDHLLEMFPDGGIFQGARLINMLGRVPQDYYLKDNVDDLIELFSAYIDEERPKLRNKPTKEFINLLT